MFVAKVTGSVVATQKVSSMVGHKLLTVEPMRVDTAGRDALIGTGFPFRDGGVVALALRQRAKRRRVIVNEHWPLQLMLDVVLEQFVHQHIMRFRGRTSGLLVFQVERNVRIELTPAARERLVREGYDPAYGARPLRRTVQRLVQDPLAMRILDGSVLPGDLVRVDIDPKTDAMRFDREEGKSAAASTVTAEAAVSAGKSARRPA